MSDSDKYLAEALGTAILILLGNGVVANVVLQKTKGHGSGWIVITAGWAFAVFTAVVCVADISRAHLNPAVTIGLAVANKFDWQLVPGYVLAQMAGAIAGAILVFLFYRPHYDATEDADAKLATFCTSPAIRCLQFNFLGELLGIEAGIDAAGLAEQDAARSAAAPRAVPPDAEEPDQRDGSA